MIIAWIIGLLLSLLGIWFLKGSIKPAFVWDGIVERPERPILRMWLLILLLIGSIIPIINILEGLSIIIVWAIATYLEEDWEFTKENNKLIQFLNKPIR